MALPRVEIHVLNRIPDSVYDALLDVRPREYAGDGLTQLGQVVHDHHENILYGSPLYLRQYGQAKLDPLMLPDPHPENAFISLSVDANYPPYTRLG